MYSCYRESVCVIISYKQYFITYEYLQEMRIISFNHYNTTKTIIKYNFVKFKFKS